MKALLKSNTIYAEAIYWGFKWKCQLNVLSSNALALSAAWKNSSVSVCNFLNLIAKIGAKLMN